MRFTTLAALLLGAAIAGLPALAQDAPATPATPAAPAAPATPPAPAAAPATPVPAVAPAIAPVPANMGRVFVFYTKNERATFPSQLALNGAWLSNSVEPGACIYFDLAPGSYKVTTLSNSKVSTDLAAGETKYVELQIHKEAFGDDKRDTTMPRLVDTLADTGACQHADAPGL